jgi:hypothetical protein
MAINWNFNKDVEKPTFKAIPVGNYRCRIESAEEKQSKAGNDMIEMKLSISGQKSSLWFYLVFFSDGLDRAGNPLRNITDRNLASVYECFGIVEGSLNPAEWIGKVGGVKVKHEMKDGDPQARVHYFLNKAQQVGLPAWVEESGVVIPNVDSTSSEMINWEE